MRLSAIRDAILEEAVRAQESDDFDSHDLIFWISRNRPRPYVQDLYGALEDEGDPFVNLHTAIGRRLAALTHLVEQQQEKRTSLNMRGEETPCERWRRVTTQPADEGLSDQLRSLRQTLMEAARARQHVSYTEAARVLGMEGAKPWRSPKFFEALDAISTFEHRHGRPLLSAVVVHGQDRLPGGGFFKMARRLGVQGPDEDDRAFFEAERERVYAYWVQHGTE